MLASQRALALDALDLMRRVRGTVATDDTWTDPALERDVEEVRHQLGPIRTRRSLVASFEREAAVLLYPIAGEGGSRVETLGAVRLAYAVRWLELGDGRPRPRWSRLISGGARARRLVACRPPDRRRPRTSRRRG